MVYNELKKVTSAKLLGLTISRSDHISDIINKASKRLYFFGEAKEIEGSLAGYVHFLLCLYTLSSYVRDTRLFYALPKYLKEELVRVEKRAMSIICQDSPTRRLSNW